jgi:Nucleotidyltransferase domain
MISVRECPGTGSVVTTRPRSADTHAMILGVEPELVTLLREAQQDADATGLILFGSAASESADEESDLDVFYVLRREPLPPRARRGRLEIVPTTAELLRNAPDWLKPAVAYAQIVWDETGELESVLATSRTMSRDETAELYDGYLNDFFRSMKAWRRGDELAGRIECGRSLRFLGELLFALDGVRAPYPKEWSGKLGDLEPLVLEVARTGDPRQQQALCVRVHERAVERGYADVYEAWDGDIDRALAFDFA